MSGRTTRTKMAISKYVTLALLLILLQSGFVYAGWVSLGGDNKLGLTIYIDPATTEGNNDQRTIWILYDFKTAQNKEGGVSFLSAKMQREYDCGKSRTRLLTILHYAGAMESGKMVLESKPSNREWTPVGQPEPGTIAKDLWTLACSEK
jgi:hypothetical protein